MSSVLDWRMNGPSQQHVSIPLSEETLSEWMKVALAVIATTVVLGIGSWIGWVPTSLVLGSFLVGAGFVAFGQYSTKPKQQKLELIEDRLRFGDEHSYPAESIYMLEMCTNRDGVVVLKVKARDRVTQNFVGASEAEQLIAGLIERNPSIEVRRSSQSA